MRRNAKPVPRRWPRPSSENLRLFTLITNTLAKDKEISDRWRGFKDIADARHLSNRVEPEVVAALGRGGHAPHIPSSRTAITDEGQVAGQGQAHALGPQCATSQRRYARSAVGRRRKPRCSRPMAISRRKWRRSPGPSSTSAGSMRRSGPGKAPGAFAHPTVPSAHPYVLLNYLGQDARCDDARP